MEGGIQKTVRVSEWAGGCTEAFAKAIILGAERTLKNRGFDNTSVKRVYYGDDGGATDEELLGKAVDEERFMDADHDRLPPEHWPEIPPEHADKVENIPEDVREAVRIAHNRLGHPDSKTLVRMMKLGGAVEAAVTYGKYYNCSTCEARRARGCPPQVEA